MNSIDQHKRGKKVADRLEAVGLPNVRHGDARDRAMLFGVTPGTMAQWTSGRNRAPKWLWHAIKLWDLLPDDRREQFRTWCREQLL